MKKIAIYGKGGIGKTTTAVNMALVFQQMGLRVLLIGCDPKQDTTRLLVSQPAPSILECYDKLTTKAMQVQEVLDTPMPNLTCCEVGGPKPGVGCAGRGILIALSYLDSQHVFEQMDVVLYDVLGDVVCGGFAAPVTKGYAEEILVVSSGEQAALFAANNIIKGMCAIKGNLRGLIYNARGFSGEDETVGAFAEQTGVPVLGQIAVSENIKLAELAGRAVCADTERYPTEAMQYRSLCAQLLEPITVLTPQVLERQQLYTLFQGGSSHG